VSALTAANLGLPELILFFPILIAVAVALLVVVVLVGASRRRRALRPSDAGAPPAGSPPSAPRP
jgi:hypothetical protein